MHTPSFFNSCITNSCPSSTLFVDSALQDFKLCRHMSESLENSKSWWQRLETWCSMKSWRDCFDTYRPEKMQKVTPWWEVIRLNTPTGNILSVRWLIWSQISTTNWKTGRCFLEEAKCPTAVWGAYALATEWHQQCNSSIVFLAMHHWRLMQKYKKPNSVGVCVWREAGSLGLGLAVNKTRVGWFGGIVGFVV